MTDDYLVVVDLFAGAGGLSTGVAKACEDLDLQLGVDVELHAINHWKPAIETHEVNHPWAHHYHARIEELYPPNVVEPGTVTLLTGGPECTHFSSARGGKPVSDQKRASAWHALDWIEKLRPEHVLLENVKEFRLWGPIDDTGNPTKDGSIFRRWIGVLESLGYSVVIDDDGDYGIVLNAADYGDPQSRERLFVIASRSKLPTAPPPTHSDDPTDALPPRRPAADIIDWSDLGESLWTRDLENPRVTPLASGTMRRIAEGIRRHCGDRLASFADVVERIDPETLEELRERVVPVGYASLVADAIDDPFLVRVPGVSTALATPSIVKYYGTSSVTSVDPTIDTITADGNHHAIATPYLVQYYGRHDAHQSIEDPLLTIRTENTFGLASASPYLLGQHSNSVARDVSNRPAPTVASGGKLQICSPETFCLRQQSGGVPVPVCDPLSTVSAKGAISITSVESKTLLQPRNGRYGDSQIAFDPHTNPMRTVIAGDPRQGHLLTPSLLRYSRSGGTRPINTPMPTFATETGCTFSPTQSYLSPLYNERDGQRPRTRAVDDPLMTVPRSKSPAAVTTPFLVQYYGNSDSSLVDDPLPTVPSKDRFALCIPEEWPWGLDIKYRMLQPDELKKAQGFPDDYEITGSTKSERTAQIGNAVPVNLARELARHILSDETPSLTNFGGGISTDLNADVPPYEEVASDD